MKITFLIHPDSWFKYNDAVNFIPMLSKYTDTSNINFSETIKDKGDVLIALHYPRLIPDALLPLHRYNLNIHGADLPQGRGRSPIHWQVEDGSNEITFTLFEISKGADDGAVYLKSQFLLDGSELLDHIRLKVIHKEIEMLDEFFSKFPLEAQSQVGEPSYYQKRDSTCQKIDPNLPIVAQFNKFRVADNEKYPIWFELNGIKYTLKIYSDAPRPKLFKRDIDPEPFYDF